MLENVLNFINTAKLIGKSIRSIGTGSVVLSLICICMGLATAVQADDKSLMIERAWIREMPPGMPTLAAYMQITNTTTEPVTINSTSSNVSKATELHEVKTDNDVMQMRHVSELLIDAGQTVEFKPGAMHIMLVGVEQSLRQGDEVEIIFELSNSEKIKVTVPVKKE